MQNAASYSYVTDRNGNLNSAVFLNTGYLQLPSAVYFSGDFTVGGWVYMLGSYNPNYNERFFDCSTDNYTYLNPVNTVAFLLRGYTTLFINNQQNNPSSLTCYNCGSNDKWLHLAATLSGNNGTIYGNGVSGAFLNHMSIPVGVTRTRCYIGRAAWQIFYSENYPVKDAIAYYDDVMFFNKALSATNIQTIMNTSL